MAWGRLAGLSGDSSHFLPHKRTSEVQLKGCNYNEGREWRKKKENEKGEASDREVTFN